MWPSVCPVVCNDAHFSLSPPDHIAVVLDSTAPPQHRDDITSFAPLHLAAITGDDAVIQALLLAGADPNVRTYVYVQRKTRVQTPCAFSDSPSSSPLRFCLDVCREKRTPMHLACTFGRHAAVRALSKAKDRLDLTAVDVHGAIVRCCWGSVVVSIIIRLGVVWP